MNLWQKITSNVKGSVEALSEKSVELSSITKLKWELFTIQKDINKQYNKLGGRVYNLQIEHKENKLKSDTKKIFEMLNKLHDQYNQKEKEIEQLTLETVDSDQLRNFRKDLEKGGGSIEQINIDENSPVLGKKLMDIQLPKNVLLSALVRNEKVLIPDGNTVLKLADKVTLIGEQADVQKALTLISADTQDA